MTSRLETAETNARFFPHDHEWQRRCARIVSYLNAVPAIRSGGSWDSRVDLHEDYLAPAKKVQ